MPTYSLAAGETHTLVDGNDAPLLAASVAIGAYDQAVFLVQPNATGQLTIHGVKPGTSGLALTYLGTTVQHDVIVAAAPFDWSVGPLV